MTHQAYIEGNALRLTDGDVIVVSATHNHAGKWRWSSSITQRYGKGWTYPSSEAALRAGAKKIGITIIDKEQA